MGPSAKVESVRYGLFEGSGRAIIVKGGRVARSRAVNASRLSKLRGVIVRVLRNRVLFYPLACQGVKPLHESSSWAEDAEQ